LLTRSRTLFILAAAENDLKLLPLQKSGAHHHTHSMPEFNLTEKSFNAGRAGAH